jgi:hypothetical protein
MTQYSHAWKIFEKNPKEKRKYPEKYAGVRHASRRSRVRGGVTAESPDIGVDNLKL